jgi:hypothetical protein
MPTMPASFARSSAERWLVAAVLLAGCRPSPDRFYGKTWTCDSTQPAFDCGTTRAGAPMACFGARQLGGDDFCAETCDGAAESSDERSVCLDSKIRLDRCDPGQPGSCPAGLGCFRTDLLHDEGVCTSMPLCSSDADCPSPLRNRCASTVLGLTVLAQDSGRGPDDRLAPHIKVDHLSCLQVGCFQRHTACQPGESCLPAVLPATVNAPDVCSPDCDPQGRCPPNFSCYRTVSGPGAPAVCVMGLVGVRCVTQNDCLMGDCVDNGQGFKSCTVPCQSDAECARLDSDYAVFFCSALRPGGPRYCEAPVQFGGSPCRSQEDCSTGTVCTYYSPYLPYVPEGVCLVPCAADGSCPARGGLPHTCFDQLSPPLCYPGRLGVSCHADLECVGGMKCQQARRLNEDDSESRGPICTIACQTDSDCAGDRRGHTEIAWCDEGVCVLRRGFGLRCDRSSQCISAACAPSEKQAEVGLGVRRCTRPAVGVP